MGKRGRSLDKSARTLDRLRHSSCDRRFPQTTIEQKDDVLEESEGDSSECESASHSGLDQDYIPTASSSSDEEYLKSLNKDSTSETLSSEKDPKGPDTDSGDEDQQRGKCFTKKRKNTRTYSKRKRNEQNSPNKASLCVTMSSEENLKDSDTNSGDEDQQRGKCLTKKHKNTRTYSRRKKNKEKMNRTDKEGATVTVKTCTKREDNKRAWDKRHYCLYCGQSNLKMARHLERKHMEIKDVAYAFSFALGSKERKVLLEQLRNKGDFKHNSKVLKKGRGQLVTWKQPSYVASVEDYLPCIYCFGMFSKKDLWRHQSLCRSKKSCVTDDVKKRKRVQSQAARLLPIVASSSGCQSIINNMRQDDVSFHIRSDSLICSYGESLYGKHGRVKSRHQYIAQRMRELGRFMLVAKDMDKTVRGLEDLCTPSRFQLVVNVARKLTQFSPGKNEYGKPSTAVKIGFCLKGAVEVLIGQTLMNDDDLAERKAKKFLELLEKNWKNYVSVSAHATIQEKRWNKQDDIPLTKNVMALRDHLRMVEDKAKEELTQQLSLTAYKKLNETVLAQVIIFNKRREGEASHLTLETYKKASTNPINEDIYKTLLPLEKELSKLLTRIEVRGKRGKKVPVFFTERMKESIDLLIKKRDEAGIPAENPYLFARPAAMTNIRGCDCLRKYAKESKAENPELLRSTKLRKQVATLCQLLDLTEQELEQVARFMGHDIRVHRDFYRQTDKTFQIAKISKLLFAMEEGSETLTGKNLNTLDLSVHVEGPTSTSGANTQKKRKRGSKVDDVEGPTSTSDADPQKKRQQGSEVDDDGDSDLRPDPHSEDGHSDIDVEGPTSTSDADPQKKRQQGSEVDDDGDSDLRPDPHSEDGHSDIDVESSTLTFDTVPQKGRKRGREVDDDGCSDLKKRPDPYSADGSSDEDDVARSPVKRHSLKEKRGKQAKKEKKKKEKVSPKAKVKRPWSETERDAVKKRLSKFMAERRVPRKEDCIRCIKEEKSLGQRSWKDVKNFVYNTIVTLNRRSSRKLVF